MANDLQTKLDAILADKTTNLLPENIKKGITVLGVTGTYEGSGGPITQEEYDEALQTANQIKGDTYIQATQEQLTQLIQSSSYNDGTAYQTFTYLNTDLTVPAEAITNYNIRDEISTEYDSSHKDMIFVVPTEKLNDFILAYNTVIVTHNGITDGSTNMGEWRNLGIIGDFSYVALGNWLYYENIEDITEIKLRKEERM